MATTTMQSARLRDTGKIVLGGFGAAFAAVMRFFCDLSDARRCVGEIERLMTLPDAELHRRGLRRDEIAAYAFRKHMHE